MMRMIAAVVVVVVVMAIVSGQNITNSGQFTSADGRYISSWVITDGMIRVTMTGRTTGWVAMGWSTNARGHLNTGAVIGWIDPINQQITLVDGYSQDQRGTPTPTAFIDTVGVSGSEQNGLTSITFDRPLIANDGQHITIANENMFLIWAYGPNDGTSATSYPTHSTTSRGVVSVNFYDNGPIQNEFTGIYTLITDPAEGLTISVAIIIVTIVLILAGHKIVKRCQESRRRRAFRGFVGATGFVDVVPEKANEKSVKLPVFGAGTGLNEEIDKIGRSRPNQFPFQQRMFDNPPVSSERPVDGISESDGEDEDFAPNNIVPSGGYFLGAQPVRYKGQDSSSHGPLEVYILKQKPVSSPIRNALIRLSRVRLFHSLITLKDLFIFTCYIFLNVGWVWIWPRSDWNIASSIGYIAAANGFWVAVPAARNSFISWIAQIPIDKSIQNYRWVGRWLVLVSVAHGAAEIIPQVNELADVDNLIADEKNYTGLVAVAALLVILFTSLESIRRQLFNFFFYTHFVFIVFYAYLWMHSIPSRPYLIAAFVVYAADRAFRLIRGNLLPFRATQTQALPGNVVRLRFPRRRFARYSAGQYVFVNFPGIALLEWHPFSLSSGPHDDLCEIHVKSLGNTTRSLLNLVQGTLSVIPPLMRVEGPYGHLSSRYKRYSHVLLVGGGVGITPLISIIKDIYQLEMSPKAKSRHARSAWIKHVYLVWSVPTEFEWAWFAESLVKARVLAALSHYPKLTIAGHITQQTTTADPSLIVGRPDMETVFRYVEGTMLGGGNQHGGQVGDRKENVKGRAAVYVCGPRALVNEAWDIARDRTRGNVRYDFHHEVFEF